MKKIRGFVDSEFVKTCHEYVISPTAKVAKDSKSPKCSRIFSETVF